MSVVGSVSVRVVPSFSGFTASISQSITGAGGPASRAASQVGQEIGENISRSARASLNLQSVGSAIQDIGGDIQKLGDAMSGVGSSLTRYVTVPIAGAAAAVGGLTAALGWGRLTSIDTAQAQLRGLGYEAADVERISGQLIKDLEGGMMDLGSATSAAAGAMAAGVQEGDELTHYIQMLDAAVVGGNGTFEEMNNIFSRTADLGYLNANNFDMMAQRMPGFSSAMQEHTGVSGDAFRAMLNDGEISLAEFLDVMDDFGGDMATEYANSWQGMVANTKNYVGIIGAEILGGVFEDSKLAIADFIDFLSSESTAEWAREVGETVGDAFQRILELVTGAISWWQELDSESRRLYLSIAGIAVAAGPVLMIMGRLITAVGSVVTNIGVLTSWVGRLIGPLGGVSGMTGIFANALRVLTGPIGWIVGALALLWTSSEAFRESVSRLAQTMWDSVMGAFEQLWPHVQTLWGSLQDLWGSLSQGGGLLDTIGTVVSWLVDLWGWWNGHMVTLVSYIFSGFLVALDWVVKYLGWAADAISGAIDWVKSLGDETTTQGSVVTAVWEWIQDAISSVADWLLNTAWPIIQSVWDGITTGLEVAWSIIQPILTMAAAVWLWLATTFWDLYTKYIKFMFDAFVKLVNWVWESVLKPVFNFIVNAFNALAEAFMWVYDNIIKPMFDAWVEVVRWVWNSVLDPIFKWISDAWDVMSLVLRTAWREVIRPAIDAFGDFVSDLWSSYIQPVLGWISDRWDWLSGKISDVWDTIKGYLQDFGDFVRDQLVDRISTGVDRIKSAWDAVAGFFRTPINWVINTVWNDGLRRAYNTVAGLIGQDTLDRVSPLGSVPAFAKGGYHAGGWAMVGEEGPELAYFGSGARILTASQTADIARDGNYPTEDETNAMLGRPSAIDGGIGNRGRLNDFTGNAEISSRSLIDEVRNRIDEAVDWVRGQLAEGFRSAVKPITDGVSGAMSSYGGTGELVSSFVGWGVDEIADWIDGKDQEEMAADGTYDGKFTANPGGFNRPMQGRISSMAGRRAYIGRYGNMHYGVDIAAPIGTAVRAAWDGVVKSISGGGLDRQMILNHGRFDTAYLHNSGFTRSVGETVSGGDIIARSGTAGSGPHLHFELHPTGWYNPSVQGVNALFRDKGGILPQGISHVLNNTGGAEYVTNQRQFDNLMSMAERLSSTQAGGDTYQVYGDLDQAYKLGQEIRFHKRSAKRRQGVGV